MLRQTLLYLSRHETAYRLITGFPFSRAAARRFVAGESLSDAIAAVRANEAHGIYAILDYLGENVISRSEARAAGDEYIAALSAIAQSGLRASVSVKLTQMGLDIGDDFCYENVARIAAQAASCHTSVCIDMEGSPYTERTLQMYRRLREHYSNVTTAIQSYLYRSQEDVACLVDEGIGNLRLIKGAYDEPASVAFPKKADVDANFLRLIEIMMRPAALARGAHCAIATHDEKIIRWAILYAYRHDVPRNRFEFQMLYGIRRDLQEKLVAKGYTVRAYIPYGTHWYPYLMRRLAERPANLLFLLRNLLL
ncbi:MAG: proline dehydrogenase family protein [Anaerolineae bacterium]|nr:proline dehydrogenase family protein [Anaerolineae bacterium]